MHWLDPDYLLTFFGTVDRFLINPDGAADGLILTDGSEVHFPPHLSAEVCGTIRPGDAVKLRGVRPRAADVIVAVALETMDGRRIVDRGPPEHADEDSATAPARGDPVARDRRPMAAAGVVRRPLHGPKGNVRGALLEDGTIIRFAKHAAGKLVDLLKPGSTLAVRGEGLAIELGIVIAAREAGASPDELEPIEPKKPKPDDARQVA